MILHYEFIKTAKARGNLIAIDDRTTNKQLTFTKTLIASLILSKFLKKVHGDYLGLMLPNSAGSALTSIGALFAGKIPVVINYSTGAIRNIEYAKKKCGIKKVITSKKFIEKIECAKSRDMIFLEDILESVSVISKIKAAVKAKFSANYIYNFFVGKNQPDDTAVILFTSGSEKEPKGVMLTHRCLTSNIRSVQKIFKITEKDIMLGMLPHFHVFGYNVHLWLPLLVGIRNVTYANPLDYRKINQIVREEKVTFFVGTPAFFAGYLRQSGENNYQSVRIAITGADKQPEWLREEYKKQHQLQLLEGYGVTEASPVISVNTPESNKPGSTGRPIPGMQVKIVHQETGEELKTNEIGKILVKGDAVMKGYFDDLEETSFRIRDGWYDTGDMGCLDQDGFLWHKGRLRRFIKIAGEMVSLVQVENVLEQYLPDGTDCCIVEVPDTKKGAKIVAAINQEADTKQILKKMSHDLPKIALPREFTVFEKLPKMGSGKVDFRKITEMVKKRINHGDR